MSEQSVPHGDEVVEGVVVDHPAPRKRARRTVPGTDPGAAPSGSDRTGAGSAGGRRSGAEGATSSEPSSSAGAKKPCKKGKSRRAVGTRAARAARRAASEGLHANPVF